MSGIKRQITSKEVIPSSVEVKPRGNEGMVDPRVAKEKSESLMFNLDLMEEICERENLIDALDRVKENAGSPGVDGMTTEKLTEYLITNWPSIKKQLLEGSYEPKPVKRVEIPKPNSKDKRKLGIPCVLDRFIQQAILQILQIGFDPTFSESSFGFRPGRSAHQAVTQAQSFLEQGYNFVVDIDLAQFFDRVNHDKLMSKLADHIQDKRVLKLIRLYLNAGIMENGLISYSDKGTPQGGPLSPLLSNIVLDELDKELEERGHKFARYADDCNIYVKSERAGKRVMDSISDFIFRRLKLQVNEEKSAVARPCERKFLGFSFTSGKNPNRRKIAPQAIKKFKAKVRQMTNRNHSIEFEIRVMRLSDYIRGWKGYFQFCQTPSVLRDLDSWIRRRLRSCIWKQWKVYKKRKAELLKRGINEELAQITAWSPKGPWKMCNTPGMRIAFPNKFFELLGLPKLENRLNI